MRKIVAVLFVMLLPQSGHAAMTHSEIVTPRLQAELEGFYHSAYMPRIDLPKDAELTVCFGGGCSGQVRLTVDQEMEERLALVFLSQLSADTPASERVAIGYVADYFYYLVESKLTPQRSGDWVNEILQRSHWECKTHAQNVTALIYQLQRIGLMRHHRLGPVRHRAGHFFASIYDSEGAVWQMDSYYGDTIFSIGANCGRESPICIRRLG